MFPCIWKILGKCFEQRPPLVGWGFTGELVPCASKMLQMTRWAVRPSRARPCGHESVLSTGPGEDQAGLGHRTRRKSLCPGPRLLPDLLKGLM